MIKIEETDVYGWASAIRGMRNPMNSWDYSDSYIIFYPDMNRGYGTKDRFHKVDVVKAHTAIGYTKKKEEEFKVGKSDLELMRSLAKSGNDHSKFARMINVTADITAPLYWWKEFDTYKVGTVANSCSTMHKIHTTPITPDAFSLDHVKLCEIGKAYLEELEKLRVKFNKKKDKKYWYALIQLLPESYNQKRTVQLNYSVLWAMYQARKTHKLDEWREFCKWCESLPYFKEIYLYENN